MDEKKVFISYSHDSDEHRERVLGLVESLSRDGCDCRIDAHKETDEDWPLWMTRQLTEADFILCVVTETYTCRFQDQELPDRGLGVGWEAGLIRRLLYKKKLHNDRIFPVIFDKSAQEHIPLELDSYDFFHLDNKMGYETLLRKVLNRPLHAKPVIGIPPDLTSSATAPLFARPESSPASSIVIPADISRIDKYAPADLIGRETELALLDNAWAEVQRHEQKRPHVITFVALGGEGKTSLVAKWTAELAHRDWPGCDAVFAWSFYSQGTRDQAAASSDTFLKEALTFFGDPAMAESAAGAFDKGRRLAKLVGEKRALLILDGLEPLQYAPTSPTPGELKDQGLAALLKGLAATSLGLCVVTTRYTIPDLRTYRQTTALEEKLLRLSKEAGVALLRNLGVTIGSRTDFEKLVEDVDGHALTLQIMGGFLKRAFQGDIRCRDRVKFEKADTKVQGGHAFRAMAAYEKWLEGESEEARRELAILRLMGLFDRPATVDCIHALLQPPAIPGLTEPLVGVGEEDWNFSLDALETAKLLTANRDSASIHTSSFKIHNSIDAHPLLREYFAKQLRETNPDAWRAGHKRLYEHLCATTPDKPEPTLDDLQPLYQAVAHGCQAGLQQDACDKVYIERITRNEEKYAIKKLGAFGSDLGAVACFFETPWSRVSSALTESDQAWLLNESAFRLRALGRLIEALEPMRAGLEMRIKQEAWGNTARTACNLSELELSLGEVAVAEGYAEQAVTYADRSDDEYMWMRARATLADDLHQRGQRNNALARFREAEEMQAKLRSQYLLLYSWPGFWYCDLLLFELERASWQIICSCYIQPPESDIAQSTTLQSVCQRATETLKMAETATDLSSIGLDNLSLGRAALYRAILEQADLRLWADDLSHIDHAVAGLRRAGDTTHLPRALLTRAWLRSLIGPRTGHDSAQSDLDEAWEIAERGPMPLHMADIHLYRARLFGRMEDEAGIMKYPWESPQHDLSEARRLIVKHGYLRRMGELEDAEAAINP